MFRSRQGKGSFAILMSLALAGCAILTTAPAGAAPGQGRCFCIKYTPGEMPPFYIYRLTPPPEGCKDLAYKANGKTPDANGLRPCDAAPAGSGSSGGGISVNRIAAYSRGGDGEGLKEYLAPFFEKGLPADRAALGAIKGGFRTNSRFHGTTTGVSSLLTALSGERGTSFCEGYGYGKADIAWFKRIGPAMLKRCERRGDRGEVYLQDGELAARIKYHDGNVFEFLIRRSGDGLITRLTRREKEGLLVEYGYYYDMDFSPAEEGEHGRKYPHHH